MAVHCHIYIYQALLIFCNNHYKNNTASQVALVVKEPTCQCRKQKREIRQEAGKQRALTHFLLVPLTLGGSRLSLFASDSNLAQLAQF